LRLTCKEDAAASEDETRFVRYDGKSAPFVLQAPPAAHKDRVESMSVFYVDVSAKIENWTADSVVALTNGSARVLVVPAKVKQEARAWLRRRYPNRNGTYHALILLAVLISLIIEPDLDSAEYIVIDEDYSGAAIHAKLKTELAPLLRQRRPDFSSGRIQFQRVKGTKADRLAREVFLMRSRRKYRHVTFEEIWKTLQ
jgi:hypothetical protein